LHPNDEVTTTNSTARITTSDPARVTATILDGLDAHSNLRGLTVAEPSLEAAFLQLTGQATHVAETNVA
jgi:hypothetical protein